MEQSGEQHLDDMWQARKPGGASPLATRRKTGVRVEQTPAAGATPAGKRKRGAAVHDLPTALTALDDCGSGLVNFMNMLDTPRGGSKKTKTEPKQQRRTGLEPALFPAPFVVPRATPPSQPGGEAAPAADSRAATALASRQPSGRAGQATVGRGSGGPCCGAQSSVRYASAHSFATPPVARASHSLR
jgi:hypothetical protein